MAYKCPKTLGNKGLSGILCFNENASATLLQHAMLKMQKGIVASGCQVKFRGNNYLDFILSSRNIFTRHQAAAIRQSTDRRFVIL